MKKTILLLIMICLVPVVGVYGGVNPASFLDIGVGARALGMGGAFTSVADDATAAYWNPAGLGKIDSYQGTFMFQKLADDKWPGMDDISPGYNYANIILPCNKLGLLNEGAIAVSVLMYNMENIPHTYLDSSGKIVRDTFKDTEAAYFLSIGIPLIHRSFYVGGSLKLISQSFSDIDDATAMGWDAEAGAIISIINNLDFGALVRRGPELKWAGGHTDKGLLSTKLGASYKYDISTKIMWLNAVDFLQKKEMPLNTSIGTEMTYYPGLNISFGFINTLSLRAGISKLALENRYNYLSKINRNLDWSAGAGMEFSVYSIKMQLDYAYSTIMSEKKEHRMSLIMELLSL